MGAGILLLILVMAGMSYACFTLYNEAIETKNESLKSKDELIVRANELLRNSENKLIRMSVTLENCETQNKKLETLLNKKLK